MSERVRAIIFKHVTGSISCLSSKCLQNLLAVYTNTQPVHDQINGIINILHHNNLHSVLGTLALFHYPKYFRSRFGRILLLLTIKERRKFCIPETAPELYFCQNKNESKLNECLFY